MSKRMLVVVLSLTILAGPLVSAAPVSFRTEDGVLRHYRVSRPGASPETRGRRLFRTVSYTIRAEESTWQGKPAIALYRDDLADDKTRIAWKFLLARDTLNLLYLEKKVTLASTTVVEDTRLTFTHLKTERGQPLVHRELISLSGYIFDLRPGAVNRVCISFNPESRPMKVTIVARAEEKITVPAGTFNCVRLELEYDQNEMPSFAKYIPSSLLKSLLSGYNIWIDKQTKMMVKLAGKTDGPGANEVVDELVRVGK